MSKQPSESNDKPAAPTGQLPPSPILPADAPPMPGAASAGSARPPLARTKFTPDAAEANTRAALTQCGSQVDAALRNLSHTTTQIRQQLAALSAEQKALAATLQGVPKIEEIEAALADFDALAGKWAV